MYQVRRLQSATWKFIIIVTNNSKQYFLLAYNLVAFLLEGEHSDDVLKCILTNFVHVDEHKMLSFLIFIHVDSLIWSFELKR